MNNIYLFGLGPFDVSRRHRQVTWDVGRLVVISDQMWCAHQVILPFEQVWRRKRALTEPTILLLTIVLGGVELGIFIG